MTKKERTLDLLRHLATRPGHDEVKADFRQILIEEFGAELGALDFERRVPEVRGRLDALIGRTVLNGMTSSAACRIILPTGNARKASSSSASPRTA